MTRAATIEQISRALGSRQLVWFGTRGDDAAALAGVPQLGAVFSIIAPFEVRTDVTSIALESLSGTRVDLDAHDVDEDMDESVRTLRAILLKELSSPSVVTTYRPSSLLSAACFARRRSAAYLGLFKDHQFAFEHKPWVESAMADLGLPRVEWTYVADQDRHQVEIMLEAGPLVIRRSRSSGGTGISRVDSPEMLDAAWPSQGDAFASVSRFIEDTIPINVGGVVWDDGVVTIHHPSVQLIGQPELTTRKFGYCGNDFGVAKEFRRGTILALEHAMNTVGTWMSARGYRGAFGCDFLLQEETPLFLELNPRFQGSTRLSSDISRMQDQSCIVTDHVAALLHLPPPKVVPLTERTNSMPSASQLIYHWSAPGRRSVDGPDLARRMAELPGFSRADVIVSPSAMCDRGATVGRFAFNRRITTTGFDFVQDLAETAKRFTRAQLQPSEVL